MRDKPFVLGLTGNIASGKSVVRQYLENAGAFCLDADLLAQETYLPGGPAWRPILDAFGEDLELPDGQINRSRLGRIVFQDPAALQLLERIVHPHVTSAVRELISQNIRPLMVVEAIKLFESDVRALCGQVWTAAAGEETRLQRLIESRGMEENAARARILAQNPQDDKIRLSDEVIYTDGTFEQTWQQTHQAIAGLGVPPGEVFTAGNGMSYHKPLPEDFLALVDLLNNCSDRVWDAEELYRLLGHRNALAGYLDGLLTHLYIWKNEQRLGLTFTRYPPQANGIDDPGEIAGLEHFMRGVCLRMAVPTSLLKPADAKALGFSLGEEETGLLPSIVFNNALRKNGFMPGEVFQKQV